MIAAVITGNAREAAMQMATLEKFANHLADDGAPAAVLFLIPVVIDALELLEIVFDPRIQRDWRARCAARKRQQVRSPRPTKLPGL